MLSGRLFLFRGQGPPSARLHWVISTQGGQDWLQLRSGFREHSTKGCDSQLHVFILDKQIECAEGRIGIGRTIYGSGSFQDGVLAWISRHHVINDAGMLPGKFFRNANAEKRAGPPTLIVEKPHVILTRGMAHAGCLAVKHKGTR